MPAQCDGDPATPRADGRVRSLRNLWRLRRYLRPYAAAYVLLLLAALAATGAGLAVPLVVQRVVDGPIARHDEAGLLRLGGLALLLGLVEAVLIFIRRWSQSSSSVGMEATIRADLYAHLQRLPAGFHDRWQSGQLLSRAISDLSVMRRFLSFGLLFLVLNMVTYVAVVVAAAPVARAAGAAGRGQRGAAVPDQPPVRPATTTRRPAGCRTSRATWPPWSRRPRRGCAP